MSDTTKPAATADTHPSFLDRVKGWFHTEVDSHKALFVEAAERLHELEQFAAEAKPRLAKLEEELAALLKKDAPVVQSAVREVAKDVHDATGGAA